MHYNEFFSSFRRFLELVFSIFTSLFWILLLYSFDSPDVAGLTIICAIIHETGHEVFLYRKHGKLSLPSSRLHGMKISKAAKSKMSYKEEALLYASGPAANVVAAVAALPFFGALNGYVACFITLNLATAASNLIPIRGYDGYGILRCLVAEHSDSAAFQGCLSLISFILTLCLCVLSLYLIDRLGEGLWIFAVFILSLLASIAQSLKKPIYEQ